MKIACIALNSNLIDIEEQTKIINFLNKKLYEIGENISLISYFDNSLEKLKQQIQDNFDLIFFIGTSQVIYNHNIKENLSLVKINLITGRSHQIRVQFSSRNHPLIGDSKYGNNCNNINIALFASSITFNHPTTKEKLTFNLNLPNRYPFNIFK